MALTECWRWRENAITTTMVEAGIPVKSSRTALPVYLSLTALTTRVFSFPRHPQVLYIETPLDISTVNQMHRFSSFISDIFPTILFTFCCNFFLLSYTRVGIIFLFQQNTKIGHWIVDESFGQQATIESGMRWGVEYSEGYSCLVFSHKPTHFLLAVTQNTFGHPSEAKPSAHPTSVATLLG